MVAVRACQHNPTVQTFELFLIYLIFKPSCTAREEGGREERVGEEVGFHRNVCWYVSIV